MMICCCAVVHRCVPAPSPLAPYVHGLCAERYKKKEMGTLGDPFSNEQYVALRCALLAEDDELFSGQL